MNIVKLHDIVMPEHLKMAKFFNERLKGKYAYWVKMRYIFPLEDLDYRTYIQYEQLDHVQFLGPDMIEHIDLYTEECCMIDFARFFIDQPTTEEINMVCEYAVANQYVADADLDILKLRNFRAWLAGELLYFNTGVDGHDLGKYTPEQVHMLEYYRNGMYNEVVKQLNIFGSSNAFVTSTTSSCKCCNNNVSGLYNVSDVHSCNALEVYKKNIHKLMVSTFEDPNFWTMFDKDFIALFKRYIDNIIRVGFVVNNVTVISDNCDCVSANTNKSDSILNRLSIALGYIHNDDITGHMNYIHDALYDWAEYLYDNMSWLIK